MRLQPVVTAAQDRERERLRRLVERVIQDERETAPGSSSSFDDAEHVAGALGEVSRRQQQVAGPERHGAPPSASSTNRRTPSSSSIARSVRQSASSSRGL